MGRVRAADAAFGADSAKLAALLAEHRRLDVDECQVNGVHV